MRFVSAILAIALAGCAELVPSQESTSMTVINETDFPLVFVAMMADTQNDHEETFSVAPRDAETRSWEYSETGSGLSSAWRQRVRATLERPSFRLSFPGGEAFGAGDVLWLRGDQSGFREEAIGVGRFFELHFWADADSALSYQRGKVGEDPDDSLWKSAKIEASREIFSDEGDGIIEGATYTCTADGCVK